MIRIFPVIVVYNKDINDSLTLKSLCHCNVSHDSILVIDNSTIDYNIASYCKENHYMYHSMNGNAGLSKAYNRALNIMLPKMDKDDLLIWLDDDTEITDEYVSMLKIQSEKCNADIFLPIIVGQDNVIYSPNEYGFLKGHYMKTLEDGINLRNINGINSCLAVRRSIYDRYRYTEELFMDLVDNQFFDDMRKQNRSFCIVKSIIHQNFFQRGEYINVDSVLKRLRIKFVDFMVYARKKGIGYLCLALLKCYAWGINLSLKTKSPKVFLKCFIWGNKNFIKNI